MTSLKSAPPRPLPPPLRRSAGPPLSRPPCPPPPLLLLSPTDLFTSTAMSFINKWALQLLPLPTTLLVLQVWGIAWGSGYFPLCTFPSDHPPLFPHPDGRRSAHHHTALLGEGAQL